MCKKVLLDVFLFFSLPQVECVIKNFLKRQILTGRDHGRDL